MRARPEQRDQRQAERWLRQSGGFGHVSPEAFDLLSRRLRARQRTLRICSPLFLLALGAYVWAFWFIVEGDPGRRVSGVLVLAASLIMTGVALRTALDNRAVCRIGATLGPSVERDEPVPFRVMFGRLRLALVIVALVIQVTLVVILLFAGPGWLALYYPSGLAVVCGLGGLSIWLAATRPTVAVDEVSLAFDERLRSEDAFGATIGLYVLTVALPAATLPSTFPTGLGGVWFVGLVVVQLLWTWGKAQPPWKSGETPALHQWANH